MMRCSVRQIEIVALLASAMVQCAFGHGTSLGTCAHVTRDEFAERDVAYKMMREAGMDCVRCDFDWRWYQKDKDAPLDWRMCDAVVDDAAKRGITVLPILCNPPDWARPVQDHVAEWRSFVRATAAHFKGRIPVYEIWNEENHPGFWKNPNAEDYVPVLRAAYEEIKAVDPSAKVAIGGTAGLALDYLDGVYKAGGKDCFDIMNVHPYSWPNPPDALAGQMESLRRLMAKYGDAAKPVWITEIGWPTHRASVPMAGVLLAGLKIARPERRTWRVGYVDEADNMDMARDVAEGIRECLPQGSTCRACTAAELVAALGTNGLDAVVYPYTEAYPFATVKAVAQFVKRGGVLADFGGSPMYYPVLDGKRVQKDAEGKDLFGATAPKFRISVYGPGKENGLKWGVKTFATDAATKAGMKFEPDGFGAFRFFRADRLQSGDEMVPLLSVKDGKGEDAVSACVYRFGSDFKGAVIVSGCTGTAGGVGERQQAEYIQGALAAAAQTGVERVFVYEFRANEKDPRYSEDHFGIVHRDFSPKPAYEMLKARASDGIAW